jgi:ribosomal-protein-alanine N-acetyltransferase
MKDAKSKQDLVTLRRIRPSDCTAHYVSWLNDPNVNKFLETRFSTITLAEAAKFIKQQIKSANSHLFAVIDNLSGRHIGNLKIGPINPIHRYCELSYFIGEKSLWGAGYGTAAVRTAIVTAFDQLSVRRLQAGVYESNIQSQKVLEKNGFAQEARLRSQLLGPNGWEDHLLYVLLNPSWKPNL